MDPTQVIRDERGVMRCSQCGFTYDLPPEEIVSRAARGVDAVGEALATVPDGDRGTRPEPKVWSVNAYTAHLAEAAEVITGRIRRIATEDRPPLPYYDEDRSMNEGRADEKPAAGSYEQLRENAAAFQACVGGLPAEAWDRIGLHERAGEVGLREIAHDMPHELEHHAMDIRQVGERVRTLRESGA